MPYHVRSIYYVNVNSQVPSHRVKDHTPALSLARKRVKIGLACKNEAIS
jgi:hypothetical protein